mgnify:CR=1 FL=1
MEATTTHPEAGVLAVLAAIALAVVIDPFTVAGALMVVMAGATFGPLLAIDALLGVVGDLATN